MAWQRNSVTSSSKRAFRPTSAADQFSCQTVQTESIEPGAAFTFREVESFLVIGGGTMTDGVYIAANKAPLAPQVQATLEQGLEDCVIVHPCTPTDVITHIVDSHNSFHLGSPSTFLQGSTMGISLSNCVVWRFVIRPFNV